MPFGEEPTPLRQGNLSLASLILLPLDSESHRVLGFVLAIHESQHLRAAATGVKREDYLSNLSPVDGEVLENLLIDFMVPRSDE